VLALPKGVLAMKIPTLGIILGLFGALFIGDVRAHDKGQFDHDTDPAVREWYQSLMQPDHPWASCCGEADAYWCDKINVRAGKTYCTITDDRDDAPLKRPHVDVGTEIEIPNHKLKWDSGNLSGHSVVFLSRSLSVYLLRSKWRRVMMTAWNDPHLSWRAKLIIGTVSCLFVAVSFIALGWFIGTAIETVGQYQEDRDRCMKQAVNGYEMERCR
jgi:hypothetical protein